MKYYKAKLVDLNRMRKLISVAIKLIAREPLDMSILRFDTTAEKKHNEVVH
jgi:hypothetical protein